MMKTDVSDGFSREKYGRKVLEQHEWRLPRMARLPIAALLQQRIGVIGAGMSGLYAGLILESLGFKEFDILEANPERVGGRVFTRYFDSQKKWDYIDYGAMRIPELKIMDRVIGKQPWSLVNYLNSLAIQAGAAACKIEPIKLVPYFMSHPNNIKYYNSTRRKVKDMAAVFDPLNFGCSVPDKYLQMPYTELLDEVFEPFKKVMRKSFNEGFKMLKEVDHYSTRGHMRHRNGFPPQVVDYLEALDSGTGIYDESFTEAVIESFEFDAYPNVKWWCVEGGASKLPEAMAKVIEKHLHKGKKVIKIAAQDGDEGKVLVFVENEPDQPTSLEYDHVINTVPPSVLRTIDTSGCKFSYAKRTGLRALHVGSSVKIGLRFHERWWQEGVFPIKGGQSSTDLPVRTIVYPSYGVDDRDATGVLLASYTWAQDANRFGSITTGKKRLEQLALANIAEVHGVPLDYVNSQYTGESYIQNWQHSEFSQGAFALFGPDQFNTFYSGFISTEMGGRYHTAGEMASVHHAWIVGALNSAWRCVYEILYFGQAQDKIQELNNKWGWLKEVR